MYAFTRDVPKEMFPVVAVENHLDIDGKTRLVPTIHYVFHEAVKAGANDILIITSSKKTALENYFDGNENFPGVSFHYTRQPIQRGLGDAVRYAKGHVGSEPFLLLLGDDITIGDSTASQKLVEVYRKNGKPVVSVQEVPLHEARRFGVIEPDAQFSDDLYLQDKKPG